MRTKYRCLIAAAAFVVGLSGLAFAQYAPPPQPTTSSTVGFWAAGKTSAVSASTSSANIALTASGTVAQQVQVYNSTTAAAFVAFGNSTVTASAGSGGTSTSDYPIAPGAVVVVTLPAGATYAAVILASSSGLVYFTPGAGL